MCQTPMDYFRNFSLTINTTCGMSCPHCDLPVYRKTSDREFLSPDAWASLLDRLIPIVKPGVVALAAREPLFDARSRMVTRRVLETARKWRTQCGFISNGTDIDAFFQEIEEDFRFDYMDLSLEGTRLIDRASRGDGHFDKVARLLTQGRWRRHTDVLHLSTTLTTVNSSDKQLDEYFAWLLDHVDKPNLVLLLLYPNKNVREELALKHGDVERIIDKTLGFSAKFSSIIFDAFPGSIPDLCQLIDRGILPGDDEVCRDEYGVLCGNITDDLFIRYYSLYDLLKYHLRISPEGFALSSLGVESANYLTDNYGDLLSEDLAVIRERVARALAKEDAKPHDECVGRRCFDICRGGAGKRCPIRCHP